MVLKPHITDLPLYKYHLVQKGKLADSTIYNYTRSVERFLALDPDLENLDDYNNFLVKVMVKKRCNHYYSALKSFILFKIGDANTKNRIIDGMITPNERHDIVRERKYISEEKILEVLNNLDNLKHKVIALIQTITGVRAGDVMRLKRGGIVSEEYKDKPVVRLNLLGKGKKRNVIFIHDKLAQDVIMNYITTNVGHEDYYFLQLGKVKNRRGDGNGEDGLMRMNYMWYWHDLKQALHTAGVNRQDFATHDFRRCFARRVWEKYSDIHVLQSLLNHSDPKVTLRYLKQSGLQNVDYHYEMQQ